jgi:protein SCO1
MKLGMWLSAMLLLAFVAITTALILQTRESPPLPVLTAGGEAAAGHLPFGPVSPAREFPILAAVANDGGTVSLPTMFEGHWTLAQFMFTGCSTTCPLQGAIFQETQRRLKVEGLEVSLLSVSIDPLGDTPESLTGWLAQFEAGKNWKGIIPKPDGLTAILDLMGGRGEGVDVHDARVYLIQPDAKLAYITEEMPAPAALVGLIKAAIAAGPQQ